jgi:hypothetical protein
MDIPSGNIDNSVMELIFVFFRLWHIFTVNRTYWQILSQPSIYWYSLLFIVFFNVFTIWIDFIKSLLQKWIPSMKTPTSLDHKMKT